MKRNPAIALVFAVALCCVAPAASAADPEGGSEIVGGAPTTVGEWPWQVGIATPPSSGGSGLQRQFCGGTLLSPTAVLTAAHCVFGEAAFGQPGEFSVITGRTTLSSSAGAEIPASDVIYFVTANGRPTPQSVTQPAAGPQLYSDGSSQWDVAIIELSTPAPPPASPIAIASPAERGLWDAGDPVIATGWGQTNPLNPLSYSDDLNRVDLKVISDADCGDASSYGTGFDPATMVCAGNPPAGGKDTCQGDSGGPLVAPVGDGSYRLIGSTSFGVGCAVPEKWGVYGRVADGTMRPAIKEGKTIAPGGPGTPAVDRTAPVTRVKKGPRRRTTKRKARFTFSASEAAKFTCALDKSAPAPCASPYEKRVGPGKHRLVLTATDKAGNVSARASYRWKVLKRKR